MVIEVDIELIARQDASDTFPIKEIVSGFLNAFRRFRAETLRMACVPEDLTTLWLGHSKKTVTDFYAGGLQKNTDWRRKWCKKAGLRFSLVGLLGLQNVVAVDSEKAA
jgi:hypothetical protein